MKYWGFFLLLLFAIILLQLPGPIPLVSKANYLLLYRNAKKIVICHCKISKPILQNQISKFTESIHKCI